MSKKLRARTAPRNRDRDFSPTYTDTSLRNEMERRMRMINEYTGAKVDVRDALAQQKRVLRARRTKHTY